MGYRWIAVILSSVVLWTSACACGDPPDEKSCTVGTAVGCEEGQVCETIVGQDKPGCFLPYHIVGKVWDLTTKAGVEGATVVALDGEGAARSTVALTDKDGNYSLPIAVPRDKDGNPQKEAVRLRVDALGYVAFPTAPRTALPIELDGATKQEKELTIENAATDVALLPRAGGAAGLGQIEGQIDIAGLDNEDGAGVLVVAEVGGKAVSTAVSDIKGAFVLFNVPQGDISVRGFRVDLNVPAVQVTTKEAVTSGVVLKASKDNLATVTGSINFANAPGSASTSVLLIVESTFNEKTKRGEFPAGLRAANVTGQFSIKGVPPGKYVVLAAFENDGLVRDPDESIGGTAIVRIDVNGGTTDTGTSFKITGALKVVGPGAEDMQEVKTVPTFQWEDDSSEDGYEIRIYNALGDLVHENKDVPLVTGSSTVSYTWAGAKLDPGMIYQFQVVSWREKKGGGKKPTGERTYISATEDLRGVFLYQP